MSSELNAADPIRIGVTGGIGAGKSLICNIFSVLGIPTYNADDRAKWLMSNDPSLIASIKVEFGDDAYNGPELNREFLSKTVFADQDQLEMLNSLVHPKVGEDYAKWHQQQQSPYTIKEAALLFEAGSYKQLDATILVTAPEQVRIERVVARDAHRDVSQVKDIIEQQWPQDKKQELANYVILNDGSNMLVPQVLELHQQLQKIKRAN